MTYPLVKIKDVTKNILKWNPLKEKVDSAFRYFDLSCIDKDEKIVIEEEVALIDGINAPSRARQLINTNDILVSTVRPNLNGVAKVKEANENDTASTGYSVLRANDRINSDYLFYWLQTSSFIDEMVRKATGANYPAISDKIIKDSKIPLPPLKTQQHIVQILDDAAALRDKTKQLLTEYDLLAESIFLEMFGDPVINPKKWKTSRIVELSPIEKKSILPEKIENNTNYVGLDSIEKETGEIPIIQKVDALELKSNKYIFTNNHILYGKLRPYLNKVANPNFSGICSTDIITLLPDNNKSNKAFITGYLKGKWQVEWANHNTSGANLPRLNLAAFSKLKIINPPIDLQNQFEEKIVLIEQQKELAKQELQESEDLFNSLLQKAFKGEL